MIEIIKKHEEHKLVERLCEESGFSIHFQNFSSLIDTLNKLINLSKTRKTKKNNQSYEDFEKLLETNETLRKFNFFEKKFTKKGQYNETLKKSESLRQSSEALETESRQLFNLSMKLQDFLNIVLAQKKEFNNKKTLKDFGYTYQQAKTLIESQGMDVVLTLEDLQSFDPNLEKETKDFDDYVAIHITSYKPNGCVQTSYSATKDDRIKNFFRYSTTKDPTQTQDFIQLGNTTYYFPYQPFRNTAHFCLNSPVDGGFFGANDWEKMKYAVFAPYNDLKKQIKGTVPQDTFIEGDYIFSDNTVLLCPASEKDEFKKKNPNATIILYDDSIQPTPKTIDLGIGQKTAIEQKTASAHLFAPFVISNIMGYKYLQTHPHYGFVTKSGHDVEENNKYKALAEGAGFEYAWHSNTESHSAEQEKWKIFRNAATLTIIEKEGLDVDEIIDSFMSNYFSSIDESLINETLEFLRPEIGDEKLNKLISRLKAINKEEKIVRDDLNYEKQKDAKKAIYAIVKEVSKEHQSNFETQQEQPE